MIQGESRCRKVRRHSRDQGRDNREEWEEENGQHWNGSLFMSFSLLVHKSAYLGRTSWKQKRKWATLHGTDGKRNEEKQRLLDEIQMGFVWAELYCRAQSIRATHREVQQGVQIKLTFWFLGLQTWTIQRRKDLTLTFLSHLENSYKPPDQLMCGTLYCPRCAQLRTI